MSSQISSLETLFLPSRSKYVEGFRGTSLVLSCGFQIPLLSRYDNNSSNHNLSASNSPSFFFEQVEIALRRACSRYFRLCCTLNPYDINQALQLAANLASELPLNLRCFVIDVEEEDRDKISCVKELFLHELNTSVPFINSCGEQILPWRATVFLEKDREGLATHSVKMVFSFSHVLGDGLSIALFSKALAEELDFVVKKDAKLAKFQEGLSLQHPHDWDIKLGLLSPPDYSGLPLLRMGLRNWLALLFMYVIFIRNSIRRFVYSLFVPQFRPLLEKAEQNEEATESKSKLDVQRDMLTQLNQTHFHIDASKVTSIGYFPEDNPKPETNIRGTTAAYLFSLDNDITQQLRKLSKVHSTTVTGLILAAVAVAYKRTYGSISRGNTSDAESKGKKMHFDFFSWGCTANLRGYLTRRTEALNYGNYSSTGINVDASVTIPDEFTAPGIWSLAKGMLKDSKRMITIMGHMAAFFYSFFKLAQSDSWVGRTLDRNLNNLVNGPKIPILVTNLGNAYLSLFKKDLDQQSSLNKLSVTLDEAYGSLNADAERNAYQYCITIVTDNNGVMHCSMTTNTVFTPLGRLENFGEQLKKGLTQIAKQSIIQRTF